MCNSSKQYFIQFVYPSVPKVHGGSTPMALLVNRKMFLLASLANILFPHFQIRRQCYITQVVCENVDLQSYVLFSIFSNNICCSAFVFT